MTLSEVAIAEFRMSAFVALQGLRRYLRDHPGTQPAEAAASLKRSDADLSASDFNGALRLHGCFPPEIDFHEPAASLRAGLGILIEMHRPWWLRLFPYGRQRLSTGLTPDEFQTFRSCGLFEESPSPEVVAWWDHYSTLARSVENARLSAQGRDGEQLTIEYEIERLKGLGIKDRPRWIALEDNSAGYDVQSFTPTEFGLKNLLIEVKTSNRSPPRMILTRGEWDAATKYGDAYLFHIWKLPQKELIAKSVSEIAAHIPANHGTGRWTEVEIQL